MMEWRKKKTDQCKRYIYTHILCTVWQQIKCKSAQKMHTSIICGQFIDSFFLLALLSLFICFLSLADFFFSWLYYKKKKRQKNRIDADRQKKTLSYMISIIEESETINSLFLGLPVCQFKRIKHILYTWCGSMHFQWHSLNVEPQKKKTVILENATLSK